MSYLCWDRSVSVASENSWQLAAVQYVLYEELLVLVQDRTVDISGHMAETQMNVWTVMFFLPLL